MSDYSDNGIETALSSIGPDLLRLEAHRYKGPERYLEVLAKRSSGMNLLRYFQEIAIAIEPRDRVLGADPHLETASAFFTGAVFGVRIATGFLPGQTLRNMPNVPITKLSENEDALQAVHDTVSDILDCSERGYAAASAYHELFEEWEDVVCPDVAKQPFLKRGFGLVIYMMQEAQKAVEVAELQAQYDAIPPDGANWDSEFIELFGDEPEGF